MKIKILILSLLIILIILIMIITLNIYFNYNNFINVPISNRLIENREKILRQDIKFIKIPKKYILENIIIDINDIVGKYNIINNKISRNSFFYKGELDDIKESYDYPLSLLDHDQVLYSLNESEIDGSLNSINILQNVDIYVSINQHDFNDSDLLISNVKVIVLYDLKGEQIKKNNSKQKVFQLGLALNKDLINILNKAKTKGKLSIFINNSKEKAQSVLNKDSIILSYLK